MKLTALLSLVFTMLTFSFLAFAQDLPADPTTVQDVIGAIGDLIGVAAGPAATTLAIVAAAAQLLSKFVLSPLWEGLKLDPKFKFVVFAISSLALAIVPLMVQGASFFSALTTGSVLLLVMQYGHRIYELFVEKKEPAK